MLRTRMVKSTGLQAVCFIIILMAVILLSGCTDYIKQVQDFFTENSDPVLRRAEPYIKPIDVENATLRAMAASIVKGGPTGDKDYQVNAIYRYIVEHYSYYSDPRSREYIQPPYETIAIGGGDCEDLSILTCSLLENLGIRTYLVLTDNHAYCLASGVDEGKLRRYAEQSLLSQVAADYNAREGGNAMKAEDGKLFTLREDNTQAAIKGGYVWYYGGNGSKLSDPIISMDWRYEIESSSPITVYVVPSKQDYEAICKGQPFNFYPGTDAKNVVSLRDSCEGMSTNGGLVIENDGNNDAIVKVSIKKYNYYRTDGIFKDMNMTFYTINNQTCVVLDTTAGKYGYPGLAQKSQTGERIAIDPVTRQYYYLG